MPTLDHKVPLMVYTCTGGIVLIVLINTHTRGLSIACVWSYCLFNEKYKTRIVNFVNELNNFTGLLKEMKDILNHLYM